MTTVELAHQSRISYTLITKIRNDLQKDGIIDVSNADGRSKNMILTTKGEELYMKLAAVKQLMDEMRQDIKIEKSESSLPVESEQSSETQNNDV